MKQLLFVVMPFGKKLDPTGTHTIDFDVVYTQAIRPAAQAAGLEVIRADEERSGSIIHIPMFERLLLAEIVVADITVHNANVFYELGIRHAARPRATILIYAKYPKEGQLPFDVNMLRAMPYFLEDGRLAAAEAERLRGMLSEKFRQTLAEDEGDSPLFEFVRSYPGIVLPPEATATFRDRARFGEQVRQRLARARRLRGGDALEEMRTVERELVGTGPAYSELIIDVLLSYRDVEAWDDMISLVESLPPGALASAATVRQQYAFALNRRNGPGDAHEAIVVLREVIDRYGLSTESCGMMGRIYKDLYTRAVASDEGLAASYLDEAIDWYRRGFEVDPRDHYPGINAATLLFLKGDAAADEELQTLLPAVAFAVGRRGGLRSSDVWDVATLLEVAALREDWPLAERALARLMMLQVPAWTYGTVMKNLEFIGAARRARGLPTDPVDALVARARPNHPI